MSEELQFTFAAREHPPGGEPGTWYVALEPSKESEFLRRADLTIELTDSSRENAERVARLLQDAVRCLSAHFTPLGSRDRESES